MKTPQFLISHSIYTLFQPNSWFVLKEMACTLRLINDCKHRALCTQFNITGTSLGTITLLSHIVILMYRLLSPLDHRNLSDSIFHPFPRLCRKWELKKLLLKFVNKPWLDEKRSIKTRVCVSVCAHPCLEHSLKKYTPNYYTVDISGGRDLE